MCYLLSCASNVNWIIPTEVCKTPTFLAFLCKNRNPVALDHLLTSYLIFCVDLEDIKALLNVQLSETEETEKKTQLKIVDRLVERRLDQISFSQLQKDVSEGKIKVFSISQQRYLQNLTPFLL